MNANAINLISIFLTGLITGGLTCLAVQGGLLASTVAMQEEQKLEKKLKKCEEDIKSALNNPYRKGKILISEVIFNLKFLTAL